MNRRVFVLAALAVAGCQPAGRLVVACDPDLAAPLGVAAEAWARQEGLQAPEVTPLDARRLLAAAEATPGLVMATREPRLADRLQRTGQVRLQNRWKPKIGGGEVQVVVVRGAGEGAGAAFGKWLMTDEAAAILTRP